MPDAIMQVSAGVVARHRSGVPNTHDAELVLISGLRDGSEASYEELLLRIDKVVTPLVPGLTTSLHDKDDLVQNVALKVFLCISGFRGDCALNSWIYRIATNEIHSCWRWLTRHRVREVPEAIQGVDSRSWVENLSDPGASPFRGAAERQFHRQIVAALSALPAVCQQALVLRVMHELSYEEIAEQLNVPLAVVKSRIFSARRRLRANILLRRALRPNSHARRGAKQMSGSTARG